MLGCSGRVISNSFSILDELRFVFVVNVLFSMIWSSSFFVVWFTVRASTSFLIVAFISLTSYLIWFHGCWFSLISDEFSSCHILGSIHSPSHPKTILPSFVDNKWTSEQRLDFTSYINHMVSEMEVQLTLESEIRCLFSVNWNFLPFRPSSARQRLRHKN